MATYPKAVAFSFGNLESLSSGKSYYPGTEGVVFNAPSENLQGLAAYWFEVQKPHQQPCA